MTIHMPVCDSGCSCVTAGLQPVQSSRAERVLQLALPLGQAVLLVVVLLVVLLACWASLLLACKLYARFEL
jgi:hypothetical protein